VKQIPFKASDLCCDVQLRVEKVVSGLRLKVETDNLLSHLIERVQKISDKAQAIKENREAVLSREDLNDY
jgi:hypothetical protein